MDEGKLHFGGVFVFVNGLGHGGESDCARVDNCRQGRELLDGGAIEGQWVAGKGRGIGRHGRQSERRKGDMVRRVENEDSFSAGRIKGLLKRLSRAKRMDSTYALERSRFL